MPLWPPAQLFRVVSLVGLVACGANCASHNVNPAHPKPQVGYVDFYCPGHGALYWEVKRQDPKSGRLTTAFSELKPLPDGVLRLESAPGTQQFQITFLNQLVEKPLSVQVPVQEGRVTPVKLELSAVGESSVVSKQQQVGPNAAGAGRKTRYARQAVSIEKLTATVQPPVAYQPKQQMGYPP